eukprot:TRINITY_DN31867_c0_g1_i1.p1 TRINITY_DN31867_c0_g1~~TRINITY_DN31867_c0_g1_i1.p1  ORF type:complete len:260 (+),score=5.51 TRINITY_DN31867_c0_g1_i1:92-871(+)
MGQTPGASTKATVASIVFITFAFMFATVCRLANGHVFTLVFVVAHRLVHITADLAFGWLANFLRLVIAYLAFYRLANLDRNLFAGFEGYLGTLFLLPIVALLLRYAGTYLLFRWFAHLLLHILALAISLVGILAVILHAHALVVTLLVVYIFALLLVLLFADLVGLVSALLLVIGVTLFLIVGVAIFVLYVVADLHLVGVALLIFNIFAVLDFLRIALLDFVALLFILAVLPFIAIFIRRARIFATLGTQQFTSEGLVE